MTRNAVALLLLAAVAGCITGDDGATQTPPPASPGYHLDCSIKNWLESCLALVSPNDSPSKTEIDVVVNPKDPRNVFLASKDLDKKASPDCVWAVGYVTHDAGASWKSVYVGGTLADRANPNHPLYGWDCITDPIMAFDANGILYYALQVYELSQQTDRMLPPPVSSFSTGSAFYMAISRDGGDTFPTIKPMAVGDGAAVYHDYPRMAVSPRTQAVGTVWNGVPAPGAYQVVARDAGASFDPPLLPGSPGARFVSGYATSNDGAWYLMLSKAGVGLQLFVSMDDAKSYTATTAKLDATPMKALENARFRAGTFYELAVDKSGGKHEGRLYCVWTDGRNDSNDIYFAYSDDKGKSWSASMPVDASPNDQFMSRPAVDGRGALHVVYYDRAFDPANKLLDASHSWSEDGGATWKKEPLTNVSFDGDLGIHQNGGSFIGDYIGISAVGDDVWMGFSSTASGRAEVVAAHSRWTP